jgi:hypothetical protein
MRLVLIIIMRLVVIIIMRLVVIIIMRLVIIIYELHLHEVRLLFLYVWQEILLFVIMSLAIIMSIVNIKSPCFDIIIIVALLLKLSLLCVIDWDYLFPCHYHCSLRTIVTMFIKFLHNQSYVS